VCPRRLCRRSLAHCRSGCEGEDSGPRIRAEYLGTGRGREEGGTARWLAEPHGDGLIGNGGTVMKMEVLADADAVAREAAKIIAAEARDAVVARGSFVMAVSGGHTPWQMLRALAGEKVPWEQVQVVQVDERVAPPGDKDRNLTHLHEA